MGDCRGGLQKGSCGDDSSKSAGLKDKPPPADQLVGATS